MCLGQVQLIHSAKEDTIAQQIYQSTISVTTTTTLRTSALRNPAEESSNPLVQILPTLSISGPSQVSRIPGAKTALERGVQPLESYSARNPGPSREGHDSSSRDLYTKRPRVTPAPARQNSHVESALRTLEERSQSAYDELPYDRSSYYATGISNLSSRTRATPPTPVYDPDNVIALHDFTPQPGETNTLILKAGDVIRVIAREPTGWWAGELDGQIGWFPGSFVFTNATSFARAVEPAISHSSSSSAPPDESGPRISQSVSTYTSASTAFIVTTNPPQSSEWPRGASSVPDAHSDAQQGPTQRYDGKDLGSSMLKQSSDYDTTSSRELDEWSARVRESWAMNPRRWSLGGERKTIPISPGLPAYTGHLLCSREDPDRTRSSRSLEASTKHEPTDRWPYRGASALSRQPDYFATRALSLSSSSVSSLSSYDSALEEPDGQVSDPDNYFLSGSSTIAAFIGYTNFHSRFSAASSKNYLIEAVRMMIDHVRYLLSLAHALEEDRGIRKAKPREMAILKRARGTLDRGTSEITEALKDMFADEPTVSEDDAKTRTLLVATSTLRACGECAKALKTCLKTKTGEDEFVINIVFVRPSETPIDTRPPSIGSSRTSSFPSSRPESVALRHDSHHSIGRPNVSSVELEADTALAPVGKGVRSWGPAHSNARPVRSDSTMRRPLEAAAGDLLEEVGEEPTEDGKEAPSTSLSPIATLPSSRSSKSTRLKRFLNFFRYLNNVVARRRRTK
ncbi:hypothetical protein FRC01_001487 [Tulasnella sp. 417]|nr:hypothetical protein FRC01_001487 [Tulasnella sp. 417]